jgi:hypothetical protein
MQYSQVNTLYLLLCQLREMLCAYKMKGPEMFLWLLLGKSSLTRKGSMEHSGGSIASAGSHAYAFVDNIHSLLDATGIRVHHAIAPSSQVWHLVLGTPYILLWQIMRCKKYYKGSSA